MWKICCVPDIANALKRSGHFEHEPQKRYDDTRILLGEIVEHGFDSQRGKAAISRINRAHRGVNFTNEDMLYVLSTFIYEPASWIDRWGWRKVSPAERLGSFYFFRAIGARMGIASLPAGYNTFLCFKREYECRRFRYAEANETVGNAIFRLYGSWYPQPIRTLIAATLPCRLDPQARQALGFTEPSTIAHSINAVALRAHGYAELFAPRAMKKLMSRPDARTYPQGYDLAKIGPA